MDLQGISRVARCQGYIVAHRIKTFAMLLVLSFAATSLAEASGQRCRTTKMGSSSYTTCEGGSSAKVTCRSSRSGSTRYTVCQSR